MPKSAFCTVYTLIVLVISSSLPNNVSYATTCAIDNNFPSSDPGNSHTCPDTLPGGEPNEFNNCCWNDSPDVDGNYHSCCQEDSARKAEQMNLLAQVMVPIGATLGVLFALVYVWTYCRDDTVKFLKPIRKNLRRAWNVFSDAICFCTCCPKKCRRNTKKDDIPKQPDRLDPNQDVPMDDFWA